MPYTLTCDQCQGPMIHVGRQIAPGQPEIYIDAWVCRKVRCPGYAAENHEGGVSRWPGMTIDAGIPLHARIRGAVAFRDALPF